MGHFLRDIQISNVAITPDGLDELDSIFQNIHVQLSQQVASSTAQSSSNVIFSYVIRFDNKGYRVFSLQELLNYYKQAKSIERVSLLVETIDSISTNRTLGAFVELRLDCNDITNCYLVASADNKNWVDSTFSLLMDALSNFKSKNGWVRSGWTNFIIQLFGVTLGFILSVLAAVKLSPLLKIENSLVFCFIFVLVLYSNVWALINQWLIRLLNTFFPNIRFVSQRVNTLDRFLQTLVDGILLAFILYVFGKASSALLDVVNRLLISN